jgi:enoyl-CoA hydratase/carnithine racemase
MDLILSERDGAVLRIEFNRPAKKNAITVDMYRALADAFEQAETDAGIRAVLIQGKAEVFTSGNDLADFLAHPPRDESAPTFRFLRVLSQLQKPIVAAVSGAAVGIGTTLLLHCDLVYAAPGTRFSLPFVNLGLVPEAASSLLLPRLAGWQRAAELLLLGEVFGVEKAMEIGLVNACVPAEQLLAFAAATARQLGEQPPAALRMTKRLMKEAMLPAVELAMASEARAFAERLDSAEAREAFTAFLEKRSPDFSKFR